jgi:hypothetical protein
MEFKGMGIKEALSYLGISKKGSEGRGKRPLFDSLKVASELVKPAAKALQVPAGVEDWARWREKACKFAHLCWDHLRNGNTEAAKNARAWLRNRGVTDETMDACLLGLHEQPGRRPAFRQKASWGVACPSEESSVFMLPYGIVIPNLSANGEVVSLRIRRSPADTNGSKYHLVKGSLNKSLVLPSTVSDCDVAVVVESELDAMAVWSAARDICHSIAIGSLSAKPSEDAWEVLKRCRAVLVSLDNDKTPAGNCTEGVLRALEEWKGMLYPFGSFVAAMTQNCKDLGEFVKAGGNVREWIAQHDKHTAINLQKHAACQYPRGYIYDAEPNEISNLAHYQTRISRILNGDPIADDIVRLMRKTVCAIEILRGGGLALRRFTGDPLYRKDNWSAFERLSQLVFQNDSIFRAFMSRLQPGLYRASDLLEVVNAEN